MTGYKVLIDDNSDQSERVTHGGFATADEAVVFSRAIVEYFLIGAFEPGMSAAALYDEFTQFGDEPSIVPVNPQAAPVAFSARQYARHRCDEIASVKT